MHSRAALPRTAPSAMASVTCGRGWSRGIRRLRPRVASGRTGSGAPSRRHPTYLSKTQAASGRRQNRRRRRLDPLRTLVRRRQVTTSLWYLQPRRPRLRPPQARRSLNPQNRPPTGTRPASCAACSTFPAAWVSSEGRSDAQSDHRSAPEEILVGSVALRKATHEARHRKQRWYQRSWCIRRNVVITLCLAASSYFRLAGDSAMLPTWLCQHAPRRRTCANEARPPGNGGRDSIAERRGRDTRPPIARASNAMRRALSSRVRVDTIGGNADRRRGP